ncbi:MAG: hypothetical protein AB1384_06410 [Actinomycetota bacterium]
MRMEEGLFDYIDDNLSERPDPETQETHEHSQHWLDGYYPFKDRDRGEAEEQYEEYGVDILEKPGINGFNDGMIDRAVGE